MERKLFVSYIAKKAGGITYGYQYVLFNYEVLPYTFEDLVKYCTLKIIEENTDLVYDNIVIQCISDITNLIIEKDEK